MAAECVYGVLPDGLVVFFVMVDNVLRWGIGHFQESLVVRLGKEHGDRGLVISEIEQSFFYFHPSSLFGKVQK